VPVLAEEASARPLPHGRTRTIYRWTYRWTRVSTGTALEGMTSRVNERIRKRLSPAARYSRTDEEAPVASTAHALVTLHCAPHESGVQVLPVGTHPLSLQSLGDLPGLGMQLPPQTVAIEPFDPLFIRAEKLCEHVTVTTSPSSLRLVTASPAGSKLLTRAQSASAAGCDNMRT
jgi:hypothetical protein